MKLSVIVPVFNESRTIKAIIAEIQAINIDKELIIVDDGSTDGTCQILESLDQANIKKVYHKSNQGKGAAIRSALEYISGDIVIIQDADLEYDPRDYGTLIEPIIMGKADVVYGSRLSSGKPQRAYMFWHKIGNQMLTLLVGILYNTTLTDIETGYKVFKAEVIKNLKILSSDFSVEVELTAKILKDKELRIYEVPISYYGRTYREGKKITWKDGFAALWGILKYRFIN